MQRSSLLAAVLLLSISVSALQAGVVPFSEDFVSDPAGWADVASGALVHSAVGGPDGAGDSFVSAERNFVSSPNNSATTIIRGHDSADASGDAFVGNWIDSGVTAFSYFVRHDAGVPLTLAARFASPLNFPGANAVFGPVASGVWTEVTFDVTPGSSQFTSFEGSDYTTIFSNIGNIQLTARPDALLGVDQIVTFQFADVQVVPEASSAVLFGLGAGLAGTYVIIARRRRGRSQTGRGRTLSRRVLEAGHRAYR